MSHPRLTKVLAQSLLLTYCWDRSPDAVTKDTRRIVSAIPLHIADRLEAALDVCTVCGMADTGYVRSDDVSEWIEVAHEDFPIENGHPYQPLVEVTP